jgi:hypothetical protein
LGKLDDVCSNSSGLILGLMLKARGDFLAVSDIMRCVSMFIYKPEARALEHLAYDPNSAYLMQAHEFVDDDLMIGSEASLNIFALKRNSGSASEDEARRLEVAGRFHVGDSINQFRHGE